MARPEQWVQLRAKGNGGRHQTPRHKHHHHHYLTLLLLL